MQGLGVQSVMQTSVIYRGWGYRPLHRTSVMNRGWGTDRYADFSYVHRLGVQTVT